MWFYRIILDLEISPVWIMQICKNIYLQDFLEAELPGGCLHLAWPPYDQLHACVWTVSVFSSSCASIKYKKALLPVFFCAATNHLPAGDSLRCTNTNINRICVYFCVSKKLCVFKLNLFARSGWLHLRTSSPAGRPSEQAGGASVVCGSPPRHCLEEPLLSVVTYAHTYRHTHPYTHTCTNCCIPPLIHPNIIQHG